MESMRRDAADPLPGYEGMAWGQDPDGQLVTWVPGMLPHRGAPGTAWRLYPKTSLVLHTHMQTTGKPETVQFQIGIHFAKEPPTLRPVILRVGSRNIDIPAGDAHCVVSDEYVVPTDLDLRSIFPHAHSLCRQMKVDATLPDGTMKPLVEIKDFDEKWHDDYQFVEPVRVPKGTRIHTQFTYDNTDGNIRNRHHPPIRVAYGSNVTDEMQDVYLQVTTVHPDDRAAFMEDLEQYDLRSQLVGLQKTLEVYPKDPWSIEGLASCNLVVGKAEGGGTIVGRTDEVAGGSHVRQGVARECVSVGWERTAGRAVGSRRIGKGSGLSAGVGGFGQSAYRAKRHCRR